MNCIEFEVSLHPYIDGELSPEGMQAADSHAVACPACAVLARGLRELRAIVRRQPRETSPSDLRARIAGLVRHDQRRRRWRPWLLVPASAVVALVTGAMLVTTRPAAPLIAQLVDKHLAYAQLERPAELASSDRGDIARWFLERARLRVPVPDFSPAGIRLVGARLVDARERKAAYLLYEKGATRLSVFAVPIRRSDAGFSGHQVTYHGGRYSTKALKGLRTVSWSDEGAMFALISTLDADALLDCAERLRRERDAEGRL